MTALQGWDNKSEEALPFKKPCLLPKVIRIVKHFFLQKEFCPDNVTWIRDKNRTMIICCLVKYILSDAWLWNNSDKYDNIVINSLIEVFLLAPTKPKATLSPTDKPWTSEPSFSTVPAPSNPRIPPGCTGFIPPFLTATSMKFKPAKWFFTRTCW